MTPCCCSLGHFRVIDANDSGLEFETLLADSPNPPYGRVRLVRVWIAPEILLAVALGKDERHMPVDLGPLRRAYTTWDSAGEEIADSDDEEFLVSYQAARDFVLWSGYRALKETILPNLPAIGKEKEA